MTDQERIVLGGILMRLRGDVQSLRMFAVAHWTLHVTEPEEHHTSKQQEEALEASQVLRRQVLVIEQALAAVHSLAWPGGDREETHERSIDMP